MSMNARFELLSACIATMVSADARFSDNTAEDMQRTHQLLFVVMYTNREDELDARVWKTSTHQIHRPWIEVPQRVCDMDAVAESDGVLSSIQRNLDDDDRDSEQTPVSVYKGQDTSTSLPPMRINSLNEECALYGYTTLCKECTETTLAMTTIVFLLTARDAIAQSALLNAVRLPRPKHDDAAVLERMTSIASHASSELGQNSLKDLILSFRMPRGSVGSRRTLLLSREVSSYATRFHTKLVHTAHQAAMVTSEIVWSDVQFDDDIRMCALLSGIAMLYAADATDVRDNDAFRGIIELPFLHTTNRTEMRVRLVDRTWYCYDGSVAKGKLQVHHEGVGLANLITCLMILTDTVRPL